jgi:hypothetical protein
LVWLAALALLAAACADDSGTATTGGPDTTGPDTTVVTIEQTRPVTVTGTALPLFPEEGADPAVGMAMPELEGASFDGTPVTIGNDGRPKVLLILAHW